VWADLVNGHLRERLVEPDALGDIRAWYRDRLALLRERVATPVATPGSDCASCRFPARCPAHPTGAFGMGPRRDLRPGVLAISPSSLERWRDCRRMWRNRNLLQVPWSDDSGSTAWGLRVHRALQEVHAGGSCHDPAWVEQVLAAHGAEQDDEMRGYLDRHARRCPTGAESVGHEIEMARFHRTPLPLFMATARLDAVWVHDGVLDVRDYKTGRAWYERVVDDPGARLQAWVAAPLAAERGLALHLRYEQLAAEIVDDPEPFEVTPEDLETIESELHEIVTEMWAEQEFAGVADPASCIRCGYRSICPDSASPAVPTWPVPDLIDDAHDTETGPRAADPGPGSS
jgi:CRISPR/Cas system-associated exonuclease Cas4 (RecB family)